MCRIKINQVQLKETVSISAYIPATCSLLQPIAVMHVDPVENTLQGGALYTITEAQAYAYCMYEYVYVLCSDHFCLY